MPARFLSVLVHQLILSSAFFSCCLRSQESSPYWVTVRIPVARVPSYPTHHLSRRGVSFSSSILVEESHLRSRLGEGMSHIWMAFHSSVADLKIRCHYAYSLVCASSTASATSFSSWDVHVATGRMAWELPFVPYICHVKTLVERTRNLQHSTFCDSPPHPTWFYSLNILKR